MLKTINQLKIVLISILMVLFTVSCGGGSNANKTNSVGGLSSLGGMTSDGEKYFQKNMDEATQEEMTNFQKAFCERVSTTEAISFVSENGTEGSCDENAEIPLNGLTLKGILSDNLFSEQTKLPSGAFIGLKAVDGRIIFTDKKFKDLSSSQATFIDLKSVSEGIILQNVETISEDTFKNLRTVGEYINLISVKSFPTDNIFPKLQSFQGININQSLENSKPSFCDSMKGKCRFI